jgi:hypothetical protein
LPRVFIERHPWRETDHAGHEMSPRTFSQLAIPLDLGNFSHTSGLKIARVESWTAARVKGV